MRLGTILLFAPLTVACSGVIEGGPRNGTLPPITPRAERVTLALDSLAPLDAERTCVSLAEGEALLDTSPEGDAWLASDAGLRVLSGEGEPWTLPYAPAARPSFLIAHGAREASWIAGGLVERTVDGGLRRVHVPAEVGVPSMVCGDPDARGPFFVTTELGLHAREGGQFWRFTADGAPIVPSHSVALASGACSSESGELWYADDDGTWRLAIAVDSPALAQVEALPADLALARDGALAAAVHGESIFVVDGARAYEVLVDGATPRDASVAAGRVWAATDRGIVRREADGTWAHLDLVADRVIADATGAAWIQLRSEVCALRTEAALSVRGLATDDRVTGPRALTIEVTGTAEPAEALSVYVDEVSVFEAGATGDHFDAGEIPMGEPGWHELVATARIGATRIERRVTYEVVDVRPLSYDRDVRSYVETHCVSCHGEGTATGVRLDSYEAFRSRAPRALARLVRGEMPPSPAEPAPADMVRNVERWIEGGMMP